MNKSSAPNRPAASSSLASTSGGDPLWLMSLYGWTFPDLPDTHPSLLGLAYLYLQPSLLVDVSEALSYTFLPWLL